MRWIANGGGSAPADAIDVGGRGAFLIFTFEDCSRSRAAEKAPFIGTKYVVHVAYPVESSRSLEYVDVDGQRLGKLWDTFVGNPKATFPLPVEIQPNTVKVSPPYAGVGLPPQSQGGSGITIDHPDGYKFTDCMSNTGTNLYLICADIISKIIAGSPSGRLASNWGDTTLTFSVGGLYVSFSVRYTYFDDGVGSVPGYMSPYAVLMPQGGTAFRVGYVGLDINEAKQHATAGTSELEWNGNQSVSSRPAGWTEGGLPELQLLYNVTNPQQKYMWAKLNPGFLLKDSLGSYTNVDSSAYPQLWQVDNGDYDKYKFSPLPTTGGQVLIRRNGWATSR